MQVVEVLLQMLQNNTNFQFYNLAAA